MKETLSYIGHRFIRGLCMAPYEFMAPLVAAVRGAKVAIQFASRHLDSAMDEARKSAERNAINK